jgi:hypothetical protein
MILAHVLFTLLITLLHNEPKQWQTHKSFMFQTLAEKDLLHHNSKKQEKEKLALVLQNALECLYAAAATMLEPHVFEGLGLVALYR